MKLLKSGFILMLAFILVFTVVACSNNDGDNGSNTAVDTSKDKDNSSNMTDSGAIDTSKFVTINYVMMGDKPKNGQLEKVMEKVNAILKEKVNAHLELSWVEWADWATKYNLLMASGEPLDLITAGGWLDIWGNATKGAFLPLNELIPKYAPLTWEEVSQEEWDQTKYNGEIIAIPENDFTQWVNHGMYYRGDWAKEFGITEPITDFAMMTKYLQGVKDNKPDVIPFDTVGSKNEIFNEGFVSAYTDALALPITTGYMNAFAAKSYDDKYTVISPIFDDQFIEFAKLMKDWADKGFWREDVLNYTGDPRAAFKAGLTGADAHHTETYAALRKEMDDLIPGSEIQMFPYALTRGNLVSTSITHGATTVGAHSKNPERALMVYELIRQDEEIYHLFNYGIEGVQFELKDNVRVKPEGYDQARDEFASNFWGGRVDRFQIPGDNIWTGITGLYDKYEELAEPYPYGRFVFDRTPIEPELSAISQVVSQLGPAILYGKVADPAKAIEDLRNRLKASGYEKALKEIQRQMDEYKALVE